MLRFGFPARSSVSMSASKAGLWDGSGPSRCGIGGALGKFRAIIWIAEWAKGVKPAGEVTLARRSKLNVYGGAYLRRRRISASPARPRSAVEDGSGTAVIVDPAVPAPVTLNRVPKFPAVT